MIQLVAFLGNYGREYEKTRHNTAWLFEQSLPFADKLSWTNKFKGNFVTLEPSWIAAEAAKAHLAEKKDGSPVIVPDEAPDKIYFLKPETYMNLSGDSIGEIARFYKIPASDILVVHDEIELPLGTLSLKWSGGLGGHNGLRSAKAVLGTADFWRMRFGVGKPDNKNIADYVLGEFTADERIEMSQVFAQAGTLLIKVLLSKDPQTLIQEWGKKKVSA